MGLVSIKITNEAFQQLSTNQIIIADLLKELFFRQDNHKGILSQLQNYHSDEDGAPIVPKFDIADVEYDPASQSGKVKLSYTVDFTFACADKRATTRPTETSNFTIHPENKVLSLFIHDKISRGTYEEF